ncbi:MAG: type III-B CRISPR module-associated protein Cmr5 [Anaerolineae bacterium]|nr:type III-B CRISPR module-associated protein Cmr5 [Anaerolineae bacterium]
MSAQSRRQALEQRRASKAWEHVSTVSDKERSDYKTRAKKLPAMIQINGLGTTMAFLLSKPKKEAYKQIYQHVSEWVTTQMAYQGDLMKLIRDEDMSLYRRATTEGIEYGIWLKRYVESWEDVEESDE